MRRGRPKFFYGWIIVGAGFAITFSEGIFRGSLLSIFILPMAEEFHATRTALVATVSMAAIVSAVIAPLAGPVMDRRGSRGILLVTLIVAGISMASLAFIQEIWQYWVLATLGRALSGAVISLGITVAVSNWFIRRRGRAIAISSDGSRLSVPLFILMSQAIIEAYSWRAAWFVLGVTSTVVALPAVLFIKRRPEDVGLLPDGDPPGRSTSAGVDSRATSSTRDVSWSLQEAVRTRAMWLMVIATSMGTLAAQSVNLHALPSFVDRGISPVAASAVITFSVVVTGIASLVWGFVSERVPLRYVSALVFLTGAVGMAAVIKASTLPWAYTYGLFYGISFGGSRVLGSLLFADYFGRAHMGAIRGFVRPFNTITMVIGPLLAGMVYDTRGSYLIAFVTFLIGYIVAAALILLAIPPKKQPIFQGV